MSNNVSEAIELAIKDWHPHEIAGEIPHGGMPGDSVQIDAGHIQKAGNFCRLKHASPQWTQGGNYE